MSPLFNQLADWRANGVPIEVLQRGLIPVLAERAGVTPHGARTVVGRLKRSRQTRHLLKLIGFPI